MLQITESSDADVEQLWNHWRQNHWLPAGFQRYLQGKKILGLFSRILKDEWEPTGNWREGKVYQVREEEVQRPGGVWRNLWLKQPLPESVEGGDDWKGGQETKSEPAWNAELRGCSYCWRSPDSLPWSNKYVIHTYNIFFFYFKYFLSTYLTFH